MEKKPKKILSVLAIVFVLVIGTIVPGIIVIGGGDSFEEGEIVVLAYADSDEEVKELSEYGEIIDHYGRNVLIQTTEKREEELKIEHDIRSLDRRNKLIVKGHEFDTNEGIPEINEELKIDDYEPGIEGIYLIDLMGPVNPEWREDLEEKGVEILNYVPNYAYEVRMTPEQAEKVEDLFFVDWVGIYQPEFKLAENLEPGLLHVKLVDEIGRETLTQISSEAEFISLNDLSEARTSLTAEVQSEKDIIELAHMSEVYYISNPAENKLHDEVATQIIGGGSWIWDPDDDPYSPWRGHDNEFDYGAHVNHLGFSGNEETVAVADTGINPDHHDFQDRVVGGYSFGADDEEWEDGHGHGSHVAGSIAGNTYNGTGTTVDEFDDVDELGPYYAAQGLAYDSELFSVKIFNSNGDWIGPDDDFDIVEVANQDSDTYIHSNSWGAEENLGAYLDSSEAFDEAVRDANRSSDENEPMVIVVAAGNDGPDYNTVGAPATAKNVIAVGSTENFMPDYGINSPDDVSSFSSRGWTDDNRIKPDVVAPGEAVYSTIHDDNNGYDIDSGTSMATPAVSGAASVVVEWYEDRFGERPSPAMVRGLLINTAYDLDDENGNTGPIPNRDEGWGMVNLPALMDAPANFTLEDQNNLLTTGEESEYTINYEDPSEPLKITLTWTDKEAGAGETWTLKNNLNLEVEAPSGDTYRGNAFEDGWTQPDTDTMDDFYAEEIEGPEGWDNVNNVQNVYIPPDDLEIGTYTVRVIGENVGDPVVGDGQDYALTMYNAEDVPEGEEPSIDLTRPVGGEEWEAGTEEEIEWDAHQEDDSVDYIELYYSVDGKESWEVIGTEILDTGSYSWLIPNEDSEESHVRAVAVDEVGRKGEDISYAFTIEGEPPAPPENLKVEHASLIEEWHWMYDDEHRAEADNAIGVDIQETWYGAIRTGLPAGEITDIAYYHGDDADSVNATIHEDAIDEPGEQIAETYTITDFELDQWNEIPIKNRVDLDSGHYWIVLEIDDPGEEFFPFGIFDHEVGDGGYIKHSGTFGWETRDWTWALEAMVKESDENDNLISWEASPDDPEEVSHYNIYRSESEDGPWEEETLIDAVDADGSEDYEYIDREKGMADDTFWWYLVRSVGENTLEEENENTIQEPVANFQIEIIDHDVKVVKGEESLVDYQVTNIGYEEDTQTIEFKIDGETKETNEVSLDDGQSYKGNFTWQPEKRGSYTLEITTEDHRDFATRLVVEDAYFEVRITNYDYPVIEGETATVNYTVENTGEVEDTQDIEFTVSHRDDVLSEDTEEEIFLSAGDTHDGNFEWQTEEGDGGEGYRVEVASEDDEVGRWLTVLKADAFAVQVDLEDREIVEGEEVVMNYTIINTKHEEDTQDIEFIVMDDEEHEILHENVEEDVTIPAGEEYEGNFTWQTEENDWGGREYILEVASEEDEEDSRITVLKADAFNVQVRLEEREIVEGEEALMNYTIINTKHEEDTQDIEFKVEDQEKNEIVHQELEEEVAIPAGEEYEGNFIWETEEGDVSDRGYILEVASEDDEDYSRLTVLRSGFIVETDLEEREIAEGEEAMLNYEILNTMDEEDTQDIKFTVEDLRENEMVHEEVEEKVTISAGEKHEGNFTWKTEEGDASDRGYILEVASEDDEEDSRLTVLKAEAFNVQVRLEEREIIEGEEAVMNYEILNTRDQDTQDIKFTVKDSEGEIVYEEVNENLTLEGGESYREEFRWEVNEAGHYDLTVASEDDEKTERLTVRSVEPKFLVEIRRPEHGAELEEGRTVTVSYSVENIGQNEGEQEIVFNVEGNEEDMTKVNLDAGDHEREEFTWEGEDKGIYNLTVASEDEEDTVEIKIISFFEVDVTSYDKGILEGEEALIEYEVNNVDEIERTETIKVEGPGTDIEKNITLGANEIYENNIAWTGEDTGEYTFEVISERDRERISVSVYTEGQLEVEILKYEAEMRKGEGVAVEYRVKNTGDIRIEQEIEFFVYRVSENGEDDHESVVTAKASEDDVVFTHNQNISLGPGEDQERGFTLEIEEEGDYELSVKGVEPERSVSVREEISISVVEREDDPDDLPIDLDITMIVGMIVVIVIILATIGYMMKRGGSEPDLVLEEPMTEEEEFFEEEPEEEL